MKLIAVVAVTLTVIAYSSAGEDKKAMVLDFWHCIACHDDQTVVREEYYKCHDLKPEKCKEMAMDCKKEVMPGLESVDERWSAFCKAENDEPSKYYDCLHDHKLRKELNDDEKTQFKEFIQCVKKMHSKFCEH